MRRKNFWGATLGILAMCLGLLYPVKALAGPPAYGLGSFSSSFGSGTVNFSWHQHSLFGTTSAHYSGTVNLYYWDTGSTSWLPAGSGQDVSTSDYYEQFTVPSSTDVNHGLSIDLVGMGLDPSTIYAAQIYFYDGVVTSQSSTCVGSISVQFTYDDPHPPDDPPEPEPPLPPYPGDNPPIDDPLGPPSGPAGPGSFATTAS